MTNNADRKHRIERIYSSVCMCNSKGVAANKDCLIAEAACELGLSRRIVLEYIDSLILGKRIIEVEGELFLKNVTEENALKDVFAQTELKIPQETASDNSTAQA